MNAALSRLLALIAVVAAAVALVGPAPAAMVGGLVLALALPGLALTAVLMRGGDRAAIERVLLAPALSLSLLTVSGLLMYAAGIELDPAAWTSATIGVTVFVLIASALSPIDRPHAEAPTVGTAGHQRIPAQSTAAARAAVRSTAVTTTTAAAREPATLRVIKPGDRRPSDDLHA